MKGGLVTDYRDIRQNQAARAKCNQHSQVRLDYQIQSSAIRLPNRVVSARATD